MSGTALLNAKMAGPAAGGRARVALVTVALGDDGALVDAACHAGLDGIVVDGRGHGRRARGADRRRGARAGSTGPARGARLANRCGRNPGGNLRFSRGERSICRAGAWCGRDGLTGSRRESCSHYCCAGAAQELRWASGGCAGVPGLGRRPRGRLNVDSGKNSTSWHSDRRLGPGRGLKQCRRSALVSPRLWYVCGSFVAADAFTRQGSHVRSMYHPPRHSAKAAPMGAAFGCRFFVGSTGTHRKSRAPIRRSVVPACASANLVLVPASRGVVRRTRVPRWPDVRNTL